MEQILFTPFLCGKEAQREKHTLLRKAEKRNSVIGISPPAGGDKGYAPLTAQPLGTTTQFQWCNHEVEFFFRRYKNPQAVAELQARIFVKHEGKGASECAIGIAW